MDLPVSLPDAPAAPPSGEASPADALMNFWQQGGGSL
jgi:hypothetical protein